jgi:heat shock protein HslJ
MEKMKQVLVTVITVISFITACNNLKQSTVVSRKVTANPSELDGAWQLESISSLKISFEGLYPDKKPSLVFHVISSRISGNTGCNNLSGTVNIEGSKINFNENFVMTKMFCPGEGEQVFLAALKKINLWAVTDTSTLNLIAGDTALMKFTKLK